MSGMPPPARVEGLGVPLLPDTSHETIQRYVVDRIICERGGLVRCDGAWWAPTKHGAWAPMADDIIWRAVQELNGLETLEAAKDDKPGRAIRVTAGMCESVAALARARCAQQDFFAATSPGFIAPNGRWFIGADGAEVGMASPDDRIRLYVEEAPNLDRDPLMWIGALERLWGHEADYAERQAFIHEWIGAVLMGTATKYQIAPILVGDGANGKSVILDVISGLIPPQLRCSVTPDDLEKNQFAASLLVGKALNCVAEIPGGELLTSARIKAIIDGSEQSAERKYEDIFRIQPRAGHIFSANALPHVRDLSHGFWRRWVIMTCTAAPISDAERRMGFAAEILAAERESILGYALRYYATMCAEGRTMTRVPSSMQAIETWRADSDSVAAWVTECTAAGGETGLRALYEHYRRYAEAAGCKSVSARTFGARLDQLGFRPARTMTERVRPLTIAVAS